MAQLAPLAVAVPLVVAALLTALEPIARRWIADGLGVGAALAVTVLCAILLAHTLGGHPVIAWLGGWHPRHGVALGISLTVDTFGAGLATFVGVLMSAALVFSARYFEAVGHLFHALMLVFMAAMVGFALTGDLFNLFVFFELMSAAAYALTAYHVEERGPLQGAINFAITNSIGAFLALSGITLIYARTGALNLAQIGATLAQHRPDTLVAVAFALISIGFLVKAAAVPLHFWLADAHAVAPTPVCVLFSGVMVQLGVYGVARVYWTGFADVLGAHAHALQHILIWLGVVTAVVGATMCVTERHLKRLLAFSTVSHTGIFLVGLGLLTDSGLAGTAVYVIGHGLAKAGLFMCVGVLLHRFGHVDEHGLRGCGRRRQMAPVGLAMALGGLVLAATPMLGIFFGKSLIDASTLELGYGWLPTLLTVVSAVTGGAVLRVAGRVFLGWGRALSPDDPEAEQAREEVRETERAGARVPLTMVGPAIAMVVAAAVVGLVPGVVHAIEHAAGQFRDTAGYRAAVLHGHVAFPEIKPSPLTTADFLYGAAGTLGALLVAWLGLFGYRLGSLADQATQPLGTLRHLHSGHVGDYVTWLTVGLAAIGGVCALSLT